MVQHGVQVRQKVEAHKRGDPKTQTSDARFDAQFAVMHGLSGPVPWYARQSLAKAQDSQLQTVQIQPSRARQEDEAAHEHTARKHRSKRANHNGAATPSEETAGTSRRHKGKKPKKRKRHQNSDSEQPTSPISRKAPKAAQPSAPASFEALRQERLAREAAEAERAKAIMRQHYSK
jgi:hypothetical protein